MTMYQTGPTKYANINESTAASNEIVAAVSGKKIRILAMMVIAAGDVNLTVEDEDGNDLIGLCEIAEAGGFVLPLNEAGWQEAPAGKALHLLSSAAVQVGGCITYQEVD